MVAPPTICSRVHGRIEGATRARLANRGHRLCSFCAHADFAVTTNLDTEVSLRGETIEARRPCQREASTLLHAMACCLET